WAPYGRQQPYSRRFGNIGGVVKRSVGFEKIGMTILLAMLFVAVKQALRFLCVLGLLMVAGSAFAQNTILRANVPFSFKVNKETLPAGHYEVRTISSGGSHVLLINNRAAKTGKVFPTHAVIAPHAQADKAMLVFKRYMATSIPYRKSGLTTATLAVNSHK